jgi:ergothioneine biosynthesis protein EgtB
MTALMADYRTTRARSMEWVAALSAEDCCAQSMPDASPAKWHLAHTTWFFETFVLEAHEVGFQPFHPALKVIFNSYYNQVGDKHPRAQRGLLTRPSLGEVKEYRANVDARMVRLMESTQLPDALQDLIALGLHHEQQHQELLITDIKHLFSYSPLYPSYFTPVAGPTIQTPPRPAPTWLPLDAGVAQIGHAGDGFFFDNERPHHSVFVQACALRSHLVSNAEYLAFVQDGGYANPAHWLSEGWEWCRQHARLAPLYWKQVADTWMEFTLQGLQPLRLQDPVIHVSYFEADAFARWAGARLPTEAEWELGVSRYAEGGAQGLVQLFDAAWQWTQSSYAAYPGFRPATGAVGEYNGKFMVNQYVLRGGSSATPAGHSRKTYRNFFPAGACWQFSGIRLARDGVCA